MCLQWKCRNFLGQWLPSFSNIKRLTIFSRESNPSLDSLAPYLLLEPVEEKGVSPDFLTEMEARIEEDESIKPMLRKAAASLSQQLSVLTMNDNYKPHIHVSTLPNSQYTRDTNEADLSCRQ